MDKPGKHVKRPGRRESDGKASVALTLEERERIIVHKILKLNNEPVPIKNIPHNLASDLKAGITKIELFKWGIENRLHFTRTLSSKEISILGCITSKKPIEKL